MSSTGTVDERDLAGFRDCVVSDTENDDPTFVGLSPAFALSSVTFPPDRGLS